MTEQFNYQNEAARTLIFEPDREIPESELALAKNVIYIACSFGELAEYVKKGVFHQKGIELEKLVALILKVANSVNGSGPLDYQLSGRQIMVLWVLTGLIGEVGEVSKLLFDWLFLGRELDQEKLKDEIFDTTWYLVSLCTLFGIDWIEGQKHNAAKLRKRYPNGYNAEDSKLRRDVK